MFTSLYFYLMVVVVIFAVGDLIGYFTGGRLSAVPGGLPGRLDPRRHH